MIVRRLDEVIETERDVEWGNGRSRRLLLARDGMGFALCDSTVRAETTSRLQYRRHLIACYCIAGHGELEDANGLVVPVEPGVMYALDRHDAYTLRATTDLRVLSIFNPPIDGEERHDLSSGSSTY